MSRTLVELVVKSSRQGPLRPIISKAAAGVSAFQRNRHRLLPPVYSQTRQTERCASRHLALVTGYFMNDEGRATFGDTEAMRVVTSWLEEMDIPYDIAGTEANGIRGLNLDAVDPSPYTIFIFVCGPWLEENNRLLNRFGHCYKVGVNLSIESTVSHKFDLLLARDLPTERNPDLVFGSALKKRPLAGVIFVHPQYEYGDRQRHQRAEQVINEYLNLGEVVAIPLDTTHLYNSGGIHSAEQFDNLVRRLDVVITTRLHGMVFSLKNGVPVVAVDAIAGGAKVTAQAKSVGWPLVFNGDTVEVNEIKAAVDRCLRGEMVQDLSALTSRAQATVSEARTRFVSAVSSVPVPGADTTNEERVALAVEG